MDIRSSETTIGSHSVKTSSMTAGRTGKRIRVKDIYTVLMVLFICMISLGAYFRMNVAFIGVFLLMCIPVFITKSSIILRNIRENKKLHLWLAYMAVAILSTFLHHRNEDYRSIFIDISILIIALSFTAYVDFNKFIIAFKNLMLVLSVVVLITTLLHIDIFGPLKAGTVYSAVDATSGGGVSAIFEYRHYYGLFLVIALLTQISRPYKSAVKEVTAILLLVSNILLTYTRNTWLAAAVCILIYVWKNKRDRIKKKTVTRILGVLLIAFIGALLFYDRVAILLGNIIARFIDARYVTSNFIYGGVRPYVLRFGTAFILQNWTKYFFIGGGYGFAYEWLQHHPYGTYGEWTNAIDIQYVSTFMNTGIIGLGLIVGLLIKEIRSYLRIKKGEDDLLPLLIVAIGVAIFFFDIFGSCVSPIVMWSYLICYDDRRHNKKQQILKGQFSI